MSVAPAGPGYGDRRCYRSLPRSLVCAGRRCRDGIVDAEHGEEQFGAGAGRRCAWLCGVAGHELGQRHRGRRVQVQAGGVGQSALEPQVELIA
jgi:hypothetical protein